MQTATQESEWIDVVSARLKRQWPTIDAEPLTEMAGVLWSYQSLREMEPTLAAETWLSPLQPER